MHKHDDYLKDIELKHKRKVSFWGEYKSALLKQAAKEEKSANRPIKESRNQDLP